MQPQAGRDITQGTQPRILVRASLVRLSNSAKKRGWRRVLTVRRVNIILGSERQERRMQYSVWASCRVGRSEVMSAIFFSFALSASATKASDPPLLRQIEGSRWWSWAPRAGSQCSWWTG